MRLPLMLKRAGEWVFDEETRRALSWLLWVSLTNAVIAVVIGSWYLTAAHCFDKLTHSIFVATGLLGHVGFVAFFVCFVVSAVAVVVLRKIVLRKTAVVVVSSVILVLVASDVVVYNLFRFHINAVILQMVFGSSRREIFTFSPSMWMTLIGVLSFLSATQIASVCLFSRYLDMLNRSRARGYLLVIFGFSFVTYNIVHVYANGLNRGELLRYVRHFPPIYKPATARSFLKKIHIINQKEEQDPKRFALSSDLLTISYPLVPLTCRSPSPSYNVLFIVVDSWRRDSLSAQVTPNLYSFAEAECIRFNHHRSSGTSTLAGIFGLFYGITPIYFDAMKQQEVGPVLLEYFVKNGYEMSAFPSAPLTSPPLNRTVFASIPGIRLRTMGETNDARDKKITEDCIKYLSSNRSRPFFSFVFYDSTHTPYHIPADYPLSFLPQAESIDQFGLSNDMDPTPIFNRYKNALHYVDDLVGQILETLETEGLLDNTIVVITGDHGEEFNDLKKNHWGHASDFSSFQTDVPMMIHWPTFGRGEVDALTTHYDVAPSIMKHLFKCETPFEQFSDGGDIFSADALPWTAAVNYQSYAFITDRAIAEMHSLGWYTVYDCQYNEIDDSRMDPQLLFKGLKKVARFYKQ